MKKINIILRCASFAVAVMLFALGIVLFAFHPSVAHVHAESTVRAAQSYHSAVSVESELNEQEDNGKLEKANAIAFDIPIKGQISKRGDVDWFKLNVDKPLAFTVNCKSEVSDKYMCVFCAVYIEGRDYTITELRIETTDYRSKLLSLNAGVYYIEIFDGYGSSASIQYNFTLETDHYHDGDWEVVTQATCNKDGVERCVCKECETIIERTINKLSHEFTKKEVVSEPTVTEKGAVKYTCELCGFTKTEEQPSLWWILPLAIGGGFIVIGEIVYVVLLVKFVL